MIATAEKTYGKVDVLFNNAGIMHNDDDNAMTTEDKVWDLTFNVNVKGVFYGYGCATARPRAVRCVCGF